MSSEVKNTSGVSPRGHAVLVEYYEPERKGSVIELPDFVKNRVAAIEQRAVVIELGADAWEGQTARAKVGDRVLIGKMAGYGFVGPADGKHYRIVNDNEIFAVITHEA
ncbi:MAG: hypothetical protein E6Q97_24635 [Desulfurellales bacterium]|nr:MAG: hypothetical protein E6Q97_24635 [Desulfurellales bacterium]